MYIKRQAMIFPSPEVCKNCNNFDPDDPCPQMRKDQICLAFEIIDSGNELEEEDPRPFYFETLGGADVKQSKRSIEPPKEEVDAEVGGEEEADEIAGD